MRDTRPIARRLLAPLRLPAPFKKSLGAVSHALLACSLVSCHLGQEDKVEDTLSFTKQYESLSKYDTVRIEVRDASGRTLAVVYQGKVDTLGEIQNLSVPGWDGGPIAIVISGYAAGNPDPIYQEEKRYDGTTRTTGGTQVLIDLRIPVSLALDRDTLYLAENGAPQAFGLEIKPSTASSEVVWTLEDSTVAALRSDGSFQGLKRGVTKATAASKLKASVTDIGFIAVSEPVPVSSVRFAKEKTTLFVGGAPEILAVEVLPARANPAVDFTLSDSSKASLRGDTLRPLAEGALRVFVRSREVAEKADTLEVAIEVPVPVSHVEASEAALTLYVRGEARTVTAKVLPANAPQGVTWRSLSPTVAAVGPATGALQGLKPGLSLVVAVSQADSSRKDTVLVSVKVDAPLLEVGRDTTVSSGQSVTFLPTVTQEHGQVVLYKWDLDGNLQWDDSAAAIAPKAFKYDAPKEYAARFYVRDTEGNETVKSRRVTVVSAATVAITAPPDNSHTNQKVIPVTWSVNGKVQDTLTKETLSALGPNTITRTARDSAGKEVSHSITVHYDTTAPSKPILTGTTPTNAKPRWTWSSGGGGSGEYRIRLGDDAFPSGAPATRDTAHTLAADPVTGTAYTLFVQERDLAGNWSPAASLAIVYNVTQPVVAIQTPRASGTHYSAAAAVALSGTAAGPVAISKVTYKVGAGAALNASWASGAWSTPALALQEGVATLVTVTATDVAGNTGEAALTLFHDLTPPTAPNILTGPTGNIAALKASFSWSAGGDGATGSGLNGRYRYNLNDGPWKDTAATVLADLPLPEGNGVFNVQAQDRALNWSTAASRAFKADITPPVITLTSHANPYASTGLSITLAGQVRDSVSGVASMTVGGQAAGSGTVTVNAAGAWTTAALTLASGANTLVLTALDQAGNSRTLNAVVNVSIPAPTVVITSPPNNHLTRNDTVVVQYTLNGAAGSRSFTLSEGSNSVVVESPPNGSGVTGRDTVVVIRDATRPNAPSLTASTSPTRTAVWTFATRGDNPGGAGMRTPPAYQYQINGGAWTALPPNRDTLMITAHGTYSVAAQEQDRAGNWSLSSSPVTIVVDRMGPVVQIATRNNFATNKSPARIEYTVDGVEATPYDCPLTGASRTCTVTGTDVLGNPTNAGITVHYLPNVCFVKRSGTGDGSSWENATSNLTGVLKDPSKAGKEIWIAKGTYSGYFSQWYPMTVYGGFDTTAFTLSGRDKTASRLSATAIDFTGTARWDGFLFTSGLDVNVATATMTDIRFEKSEDWTSALLQVRNGANLTANNFQISNNVLQGSAVSIMSASATFNGGSVVGNRIPTDFNGAMFLSASTVTLSGGFSLYGNTDLQSNNLNTQLEMYSGSVLNVATGVNFDCDGQDLVNDGGSGTCKGRPFP